MRDWSEAELREKLTARQYEVLSLVAQRYSSKDIGRQLGLSFRTIDGYISDIVLRLEVPSRADAGRLFLEVQNRPVENTGVAGTLDEPVETEPMIPQPAGFELEAESSEMPDGAAVPMTGFWSFLLEIFTLPPVGGPTHEMTLLQRAKAVGQIGLVSMAVVAAIVVLIVGIFRLLIGR